MRHLLVVFHPNAEKRAELVAKATKDAVVTITWQAPLPVLAAARGAVVYVTSSVVHFEHAPTNATVRTLNDWLAAPGLPQWTDADIQTACRRFQGIQDIVNPDVSAIPAGALCDMFCHNALFPCSVFQDTLGEFMPIARELGVLVGVEPHCVHVPSLPLPPVRSHVCTPVAPPLHMVAARALVITTGFPEPRLLLAKLLAVVFALSRCDVFVEDGTRFTVVTFDAPIETLRVSFSTALNHVHVVAWQSAHQLTTGLMPVFRLLCTRLAGVLGAAIMEDDLHCTTCSCAVGHMPGSMPRWRWHIAVEADDVQLGAGSSGQVTRGRWHGTPVAIKWYDARHGDDDAAALAHCAREMDILAQLQGHPHVVRMLGFGTQPTCLVMELCTSGTLREWMRRPNRPVRKAITMARGIAAAVDSMHAHSIVHCDLKPRNVLVTPDDTPRVCDFDCAVRVNNAVLRMGRPGGTKGYMAPEQTMPLATYGGRGVHFISPKTDMWSLGVVMCKVLTGADATKRLSATSKAALSTPKTQTLSLLSPALAEAAYAMRAAALQVAERTYWPLGTFVVFEGCVRAQPGYRLSAYEVAMALDAAGRWPTVRVDNPPPQPKQPPVEIVVENNTCSHPTTFRPSAHRVLCVTHEHEYALATYGPYVPISRFELRASDIIAAVCNALRISPVTIDALCAQRDFVSGTLAIDAGIPLQDVVSALAPFLTQAPDVKLVVLTGLQPFGVISDDLPSVPCTLFGVDGVCLITNPPRVVHTAELPAQVIACVDAYVPACVLGLDTDTILRFEKAGALVQHRGRWRVARSVNSSTQLIDVTIDGVQAAVSAAVAVLCGIVTLWKSDAPAGFAALTADKQLALLVLHHAATAAADTLDAFTPLAAKGPDLVWLLCLVCDVDTVLQAFSSLSRVAFSVDMLLWAAYQCMVSAAACVMKLTALATRCAEAVVTTLENAGHVNCATYAHAQILSAAATLTALPASTPPDMMEDTATKRKTHVRHAGSFLALQNARQILQKPGSAWVWLLWCTVEPHFHGVYSLNALHTCEDMGDKILVLFGAAGFKSINGLPSCWRQLAVLLRRQQWWGCPLADPLLRAQLCSSVLESLHVDATVLRVAVQLCARLCSVGCHADASALAIGAFEQCAHDWRLHGAELASLAVYV